MYMCKAENIVGLAETSAVVTVRHAGTTMNQQIGSEQIIKIVTLCKISAMQIYFIFVLTHNPCSTLPESFRVSY